MRDHDSLLEPNAWANILYNTIIESCSFTLVTINDGPRRERSNAENSLSTRLHLYIVLIVADDRKRIQVTANLRNQAPSLDNKAPEPLFSDVVHLSAPSAVMTGGAIMSAAHKAQAL